jgi:hypothetical protein
MVRTTLWATLGFGVLLCGRLWAQMPPPAASNAAFDQLKSLAGTWEGKLGDKTAKLTFEIVSNGSVIMERLQPSTEPEMITMYSLEGKRLVVTHYCSMGNQPTTQTESLSGASAKYDFRVVRVSRTRTAGEAHMVGLTLTMPNKDHLTQVWTFEDNGKTNSETFTCTRKTSPTGI